MTEGETKENETQVREGTDRRIIIVKQGKARKGKLRERGEVRKYTEKYGEIRCAEKVEKCGNDFSKIMVKVKCHVMSHEVLRYVTLSISQLYHINHGSNEISPFLPAYL